MAILVTLKGPLVGRHFSLDAPSTVLGRQDDAAIWLDALTVSRHHARIVNEDGTYFVEDLHSSNGTFVNGKQVQERLPLIDGDKVQLGPFTFQFRHLPTPGPADTDLIIRERVPAELPDPRLPPDPARKLEVVLAIAQHLARTLDADTLLGKLLDHVMGLFPQADRALVVLAKGDDLVVRAHRWRSAHAGTHPYSRTVVRRALQEGVGLLSEDIPNDQRFQSASSVTSLNVRSLLCVPLIGQIGRRLGAVQLECFHEGERFRLEDLQLLTAIGQQVAVVLDNAALHAELLRQERLHQELALARQIQEGFLPVNFPAPEEHGFELFARVNAAREVSGDLYDFFFLPDGRLAFLVGDVSGKGMPAALFMVAIRSLTRHPATADKSPAETLRQLNAALAAGNYSGMFVTLVYGMYDPASGHVVLASGAHPQPLLRNADGRVEVVPLHSSRPLGLEVGGMGLTDTELTLAPGAALVLYTDGFTEACAPDSQTLFGLPRLQEALGGPRTQMSLQACADHVETVVAQFTEATSLQDDQTLFLLRRGSSGQ